MLIILHAISTLIYMYTHILAHTHTHTYIYIYIYKTDQNVYPVDVDIAPSHI